MGEGVLTFFIIITVGFLIYIHSDVPKDREYALWDAVVIYGAISGLLFVMYLVWFGPVCNQ